MKPKKDPDSSTAYVLVRHVWDHSCQEVRHSWRTVNRVMHDALALAIMAGLTFAPEDIGRMYDEMRGSYWFPLWGSAGRGEGFYCIAVEADNLSACKSFEHWKHRPPFVFGGERLHVGAKLGWEGDPCAKVTSFAEDGQSLIACVYDSKDEHGPEHKVIKRFTITIEQILTAEKKFRAEQQVCREVARISRFLKYSNIDIPDAVVRNWTKAQRKEASEWLEGYTRVTGAPPPDFFPSTTEG